MGLNWVGSTWQHISALATCRRKQAVNMKGGSPDEFSWLRAKHTSFLFLFFFYSFSSLPASCGFESNVSVSKICSLSRLLYFKKKSPHLICKVCFFSSTCAGIPHKYYAGFYEFQLLHDLVVLKSKSIQGLTDVWENESMKMSFDGVNFK